LTDEQLRQVPSGSLHSIAWLLWHIARTEDVTINVLLANTDQLLFADHWFERLGIPARDIGTEMSAADITALSARIDLAAVGGARGGGGVGSPPRRPHRGDPPVRPSDIGTEMSAADITALSARIDLAAVRAYRLAVGERTREIVQQVTDRELRQTVEPERIERVKAEGALVPAAYGVAEYWGRHTKGNLLLIPATRHSFTHLNEAVRMRQKLRRRRGAG
jgi:hypothetical protein